MPRPRLQSTRTLTPPSLANAIVYLVLSSGDSVAPSPPRKFTSCQDVPPRSVPAVAGVCGRAVAKKTRKETRTHKETHAIFMSCPLGVSDARQGPKLIRHAKYALRTIDARTVHPVSLFHTFHVPLAGALVIGFNRCLRALRNLSQTGEPTARDASQWLSKGDHSHAENFSTFIIALAGAHVGSLQSYGSSEKQHRSLQR